MALQGISFLRDKSFDDNSKLNVEIRSLGCEFVNPLSLMILPPIKVTSKVTSKVWKYLNQTAHSCFIDGLNWEVTNSLTTDLHFLKNWDL